MKQCACGRPLWDGMEACEFCANISHKDRRRFKNASNLDRGFCSGHERVIIRKRMANLGRGYD